MPSTSYKINIPKYWNKLTYNDFIKELLKLEDKKYLEFNKKITPTNYKMIGIRVPILKKIAKDIKKTNLLDFLNNTNGEYFEEILLEGLVIGSIDEYNLFLKYFKKYLKRIDNWAVCDLSIASFKIIKLNKGIFIKNIDKLVKSSEPFVVRVGIVCLLIHYVEDREYLKYIFNTIDKVESNDYYVNMAISWLISYLFIYYKEETLSYLEHNNLNKFTQNKAISKIRDSYRVSYIDKEMVLKYKR